MEDFNKKDIQIKIVLLLYAVIVIIKAITMIIN